PATAASTIEPARSRRALRRRRSRRSWRASTEPTCWCRCERPGVRKKVSSALDWLHSRTGYRTGRNYLLDEPLPPGTRWWFVTGSILMFLLTVQIVTGIVLAMFYVPSPGDAYDSVRYIMERLAFGHVLRGLHFFGASFIVIAAIVHMTRVFVFASYK